LEPFHFGVVHIFYTALASAELFQ